MARRLQVLGQPTRIRLIDGLDADGEDSVQHLAQAVGITQYNASQHLAVLRESGIVRRRQQGRIGYYSLADRSAISVYERVAVGLADQYHRLGRELSEE